MIEPCLVGMHFSECGRFKPYRQLTTLGCCLRCAMEALLEPHCGTCARRLFPDECAWFRCFQCRTRE
jgi:hypothetical protein